MTKAHPRGGMSCLRKYYFLALMAIGVFDVLHLLGYVHIEPISITIAYLPMLIAGCFLGVGPSAAMGLFFGLASMYKASANYVMPMDKLFSPFFSGAPVASLAISVGRSRAVRLAGGGCSFRSEGARAIPGSGPGIIAALAPRLAFPAGLYGDGPAVSATGLWARERFPRGRERRAPRPSLPVRHRGAVGAFSATKSCGILRPIWSGGEKTSAAGTGPHWPWLLFLACVLCAAVASTFYFAQRTAYMLSVYGISLAQAAEHDLLHLQIQSLLATLSLTFLLGMCILIAYRYLTYREYIGQLDAVTGIMGRKMFNRYCEDQLCGRGALAAEGGWFLFVDVDYFKSINDTLGHPVGDLVLKRIAQTLKSEFFRRWQRRQDGRRRVCRAPDGAVAPVPRCRKAWIAFCATSPRRSSAPETVSCSIGVCRFFPPAGDAVALRADGPPALRRQAPRARLLCVRLPAGWRTAADGGLRKTRKGGERRWPLSFCMPERRQAPQNAKSPRAGFSARGGEKASAPGGGAQRVHHVEALPGKVEVVAAKVTVGGHLLVDGPLEIEAGG